MKDKCKFMVGNEFEYICPRSNEKVKLLSADSNGEFFIWKTYLTYRNSDSFILTGITADTLIALGLENGTFFTFFEGEVEVIGENDFTINQLEDEELGQFYLRVARELGWVEG